METRERNGNAKSLVFAQWGGTSYFYRNAANFAKARHLGQLTGAKLVKSLRCPPPSVESFNWFPDLPVERIESGTYFALADTSVVLRVGGDAMGRLDVPDILKLFTLPFRSRVSTRTNNGENR